MDGGPIELQGLVKTYRGGPHGPVPAVRGIDLSIERGETVALLGPNGAGKTTTIDMMLGLTPPDAGEVSVFGKSPSEAVEAGAVGAMLQTGELIRDLSVRELVGLMASLYPRPMVLDDVLAAAGLDGVADQRTQKLFRGADPAGAVRGRACSRSAAAGARRADRGDGRARQAGFLGSDARVRRPRADGAIRHHYLEEADANADRAVLMADGGIVADGPTTEIKARVGTRTIRATLPDAELTELEGLTGVSSAERHGEAVILRCADSDAAIPGAA